MAEEISDDRFKSEMTRFMETVILKLGEHDRRFDGLGQRFDGLEHRFDGLEQRFDGLERKVDKNTEEIILLKKNVKILSAQFTDVVGMVLEDNKRITKLEKEVEDLQGNIN